ncbi:MAG: ankyrin repeat domain-containing protein [bacterium]
MKHVLRKALLSIILVFTFSTPLFAQELDDLRKDLFNYISNFDVTEDPSSKEYTSSVIEYIEETYIKEGIGINDQDEFKNTVLHVATYKMNMFLLEKVLPYFQPDPNIKNIYDKTPLDIAREIQNRNKGWGVGEDLFSFLEKYQQTFNVMKSYEIAKVETKDDKLEDRAFALYAMINKTMTIYDAMVIKYIFHDAEKQLLKDAFNKKDEDVLKMIKDIDEKWTEKINSLLKEKMDKVYDGLKTSTDISDFKSAEIILSELDTWDDGVINQSNNEQMAKMYNLCKVNIYKLSPKDSIEDLKARLALIVLGSTLSLDDLIDKAVEKILDEYTPFDKTKILIIMMVSDIVTNVDYKGKYAQPEFIKALNGIYDISASHDHDFKNIDEEKMDAAMEVMKTKTQLIKDLKLLRN